MKYALTAIAGILISGLATAAVDPMSGSYIQQAIDYQGKDLDLNVKFERVYNSRSNHRGWFGYGWCSNFETRIETTPDNIKFIYCGDGSHTTYNKTGNQYTSAESKETSFKKVGSNFVRTSKDGVEETFDQEGRLTRIKRGKDHISLKYKGSVPSELVDSGGRKVQVLSKDNQITEISFETSLDGKTMKEKIASYTYDGEHLKSVNNFWNNTYSYSYDKQNNLVKSVWPNGEEVKISYNSNDWVKSVVGHDLCVENYDYTMKGSARDNYEVKVTNLCKNEKVDERIYTFKYNESKTRTVSSEAFEDGQNREYKYDDNGQVIQIVEKVYGRNGSINEIITNVTRDSNGRISKVENQFERKSYLYIPHDGRYFIGSIKIEDLSGGKTVNSFTHGFEYKNAKLSAYKKPDGEKLMFSYDDDGQLQTARLGNLVAAINYAGNTVIGVTLNGKKLPMDIYSIEATPEEIKAVNLYLGYATALNLLSINLP